MGSYDVISFNLLYILENTINIVNSRHLKTDFDPEENKECILDLLLAIKDILYYGFKAQRSGREGSLWRAILSSQKSLTKTFNYSVDAIKKLSIVSSHDDELLLAWMCDCWLKKLLVKNVAAMMSKKFNFSNHYEEYSIMKSNERRVLVNRLKTLEGFNIYFDIMMLDYSSRSAVNLSNIFGGSDETNLNFLDFAKENEGVSLEEKSLTHSICASKSFNDDENGSIDGSIVRKGSVMSDFTSDEQLIKSLQDEVAQLKNKIAKISVASPVRSLSEDAVRNSAGASSDFHNSKTIKSLESLLKTTKECYQQKLEECVKLTKEAEKYQEEISKISNEACLYSQLNIQLSNENEYMKKQLSTIMSDFGKYGEKTKVLAEKNEVLNEKINFYESSKWLSDDDVKKCLGCSVLFTTTLRRHHCRRCGKIFCKKCCYQFFPLIRNSPPSRTCEECIKFIIWQKQRE